jgi:peroxiredoxin Q/BCP
MTGAKAKKSTPEAAAKKAPSVPKVGSPAPTFSLPADGGETISLKDYKGKWVVLFFYPKDSTPGCTREAVSFEAAGATLRKKGAVVLGVSRDSIASHCNFKEKQNLRFPLLSDPTADVHKAYGAFGEKMMYGKKVIGAIRTTALIGPDGKLERLFSKVRVDGHADAVLVALDEGIAAAKQARG